MTRMTQNMKTPSLQTLLHLAIEAARLGGARTLRYFNTGVRVETKADLSPVTRADRESEAIIRRHIARAYPHHSILGEEGGLKEGDPDHRWIVDPIDGTKSFIHGVPIYGVLIGVEVRGKASVGVAYFPALDEILTAADGLGCRWNGKRTHVSKVSKLDDAILLVSDTKMTMERSDAYTRLAARTRFQRTWGDCYGYLLVATGRAEIMLDPVMNPWDCAPFLPILREAGGHFTDWTGKPTIRGKDSVATNAALHKKVLGVLRKYP